MEQPVDGRLPGDRDPFLGLLAEGRQVAAGLAVDHDAAAARQVREDRIVGDREAAARVGHDQAFRAGDRERPRAAFRAPRPHRPAAGGARRTGATRSPRPIFSKSSSGLSRPSSVATAATRSAGSLRSAEREVLERLVQQPLAELDGFAALQVLEVVPDRRARLGGDDEIHPGRVRRRALGGDDLDRLAVAQRRAQRHEAPIDLRRDAAIADVGVHGVGEVDAGRAARQAADFALGREHVDLVGEQVDLDALQEFLGACRPAGSRPAAAATRARDRCATPIARVARLVLPVRRDARLGDRCMSSVRICTSIGMPFGPNSVVCSDW